MEHPAIRDALLSGEINSAVSAHLETCPDCAALAADLQEIDKLAPSLELEVVLRPGLVEKVLARIAEDRAARRLQIAHDDFREAVLSGEISSAVSAHLEGCADCSTLMVTLQGIDKLAPSLEAEVEEHPDLVEKILTRIAEDRSGRHLDVDPVEAVVDQSAHDPDEAMGARAFQQAIASDHPDEAPPVGDNLGITLAKEREVDGARAASQQTIDSQHPGSAPHEERNLGRRLLPEQGDVGGARATFQRAIQSGHSDEASAAAVNVGRLLGKARDLGVVRRLLGIGSPSEVEGQRFFSRAAGPTETVEVGGESIQLPIHYRRTDVFTAFFTAGRDAVARLLPEGLHPVNMGRDRTPLAIAGMNYLDSSLGPYGEVAILVPCTHGRSAPAIMSAALQTLVPGFGYFVVHLPVTTPLAHDVGRSVWGYPKFLADIDFDRTPGHQRVHLAEGGSEILSLSVPQRGLPVRDNRPWVTFATRDTDLLRVTSPCRSIYQVLPGGAGVRLQLGDHRIAAQLRRLGISTRPLFSMNYLYYASVLPAGETVDLVDRPYVGYRPGRRDLMGRVGGETQVIGQPAPGASRRYAPLTSRDAATDIGVGASLAPNLRGPHSG